MQYNQIIHIYNFPLWLTVSQDHNQKVKQIYIKPSLPSALCPPMNSSWEFIC